MRMGTDFESHSEFAISDDLWYCSLWFIGSLREVEPHLLKITILSSSALIVTIDTPFAPTLFLMVSLRLHFFQLSDLMKISPYLVKIL